MDQRWDTVISASEVLLVMNYNQCHCRATDHSVTALAAAGGAALTPAFCEWLPLTPKQMHALLDGEDWARG